METYNFRNLWRVTLRLWTPYILYDKISVIKVNSFGGLYMAERCICCGKKIGLLNGSHLNNQVCDNCYFPVGGYITSIEENNDLKLINENREQLINKIQALQYTSIGKEYIINYTDSIINKKKNVFETEEKYNQLVKDLKITTTNSIKGYDVKKYLGIISKSTFLGIGTFEFGDIGQSVWHGMESETFSDKLEQAKNSSINKMINEVIKRGGNAIIGVTFDYINFGTDMIGVVANGTVVEIVKQNSRGE